MSYPLTAAALGIAWYLALLIPLSTREMLAAGRLERADIPFVLWRMFLVCAVSVTLAVVFRQRIIRASTTQAIILGVLLPVAGAALFSLGSLLLPLIRGWTGRQVSPISLTIVLMTPLFGMAIAAGHAFYVLIPMGIVSQAVMARVGRGRSTTAHGFSASAAMIVVASLGVMAWVKQTDGIHEVTKEMSWSAGPASPDITARHVILALIDRPDDYIGIYSDDLARYLESRPQKTVPVRFEVTYRLLGMTGYTEKQIGDLTQWSSLNGYGSMGPDSFKD